jgi:hypothetical protein
VYEMLARKCRLILAIDAGADPEMDLGDLGIAQRVALLDLGVRIVFANGDLEKIKEKKSSFAVATIDYGPRSPVGKLIYVKPMVLENEPASVIAYGSMNEKFPHEPTIDQWFNESQFNAYFQLGEHIGSSVPLKIRASKLQTS